MPQVPANKRCGDEEERGGPSQLRRADLGCHAYLHGSSRETREGGSQPSWKACLRMAGRTHELAAGGWLIRQAGRRSRRAQTRKVRARGAGALVQVAAGAQAQPRAPAAASKHATKIWSVYGSTSRNDGTTSSPPKRNYGTVRTYSTVAGGAELWRGSLRPPRGGAPARSAARASSRARPRIPPRTTLRMLARALTLALTSPGGHRPGTPRTPIAPNL